MMATAAGAATAAAEIFFSGHAAEFQGFVDVLMDGFLDLLQFFLGIEEAASDGVIEQLLAMLFEIRDFLAAERHGGLLLLLERLAFAHEAVILGAGFFVADKGIDALADRAHVGLVQDGLAKFLGLPQHCGLFDGCLHKFF
jgi:hypothetical protein